MDWKVNNNKIDSQENLIYLKVDDCYLDGISQFRIAIDQMNSSFMDLIYYSNDFRDSCKNIVIINNEFIRKLIKADSLTHDKTFKMIQEYYELTDGNKKKVSQLLEDIKKDIQQKFDDYYESDESPKSESFKTKSKLPDNKFDSLKKILDKSRDSIDSDDISDDFMESKIIPLYKDDDYDEGYPWNPYAPQRVRRNPQRQQQQLRAQQQREQQIRQQQQREQHQQQKQQLQLLQQLQQLQQQL